LREILLSFYSNFFNGIAWKSLKNREARLVPEMIDLKDREKKVGKSRKMP